MIEHLIALRKMPFYSKCSNNFFRFKTWVLKIVQLDSHKPNKPDVFFLIFEKK